MTLCETEVKCINGPMCVTTNQAKDKELRSKASGQCYFDSFGGDGVRVLQTLSTRVRTREWRGETIGDQAVAHKVTLRLVGDHYPHHRALQKYNAPISRANIAAARQIDLDPGTNGGGSTDRPAGPTQSESFSDETMELNLS
ncbi:hypothetical protein PoB_005369500 [Plakobranchus ocellatus]|uniref:Uncharacterized protein n=1 Tax=Plakobranchus ocellatus TaxID=259542 RepID=A0AAV4C3E7_9GAST|nr:hypothetical protein PoB_005369500 [Plakobranchus ocellatus]